MEPTWCAVISAAREVMPSWEGHHRRACLQLYLPFIARMKLSCITAECNFTLECMNFNFEKS